jgi:hypothetical protein
LHFQGNNKWEELIKRGKRNKKRNPAVIKEEKSGGNPQVLSELI